jgi:hypothetical protein
MSALGQKQTYALQERMSDLLPKADVCAALANVCYEPKADMPPPKNERPRQDRAEAAGTALLSDHAAYLA